MRRTHPTPLPEREGSGKRQILLASRPFAGHSGLMNKGVLAQATIRASEALDAVYRTFEMPAPSTIEGCPCCIDTRGTDVLLATPLREISGMALWRYVSGAFLTVGDEQDFRYLLPRILDVSVSDPANANNPEIVLGKLSLAGWDSWPPHEKAVIEMFVGAWFELALASDLAEADEGWIGWAAESVLCGAARAGVQLDRWLLRLAAPDVAPVLADIRDRFPREPSGFWEDVPWAFHAVRVFLDQGRA